MPEPIRGQSAGRAGRIQQTPAEPAQVTPKKPVDFGGVTPTAEQVAGKVREQFDAVAARIRDGVTRGLDKPAIVRELAQNELADLFRGKVTDALVNEVAEAVLRDPNFSQLFNKLFRQATKA